MNKGKYLFGDASLIVVETNTDAEIFYYDNDGVVLFKCPLSLLDDNGDVFNTSCGYYMCIDEKYLPLFNKEKDIFLEAGFREISFCDDFTIKVSDDVIIIGDETFKKIKPLEQENNIFYVIDVNDKFVVDDKLDDMFVVDEDFELFC